MLRKEIVDRLAEKGYTKKDARTILDDVFTMINEVLLDGDDVVIHGFGMFTVKDIKERESIDVNTKERITIPAYKAPRFVAGDTLRRSIKEGRMIE